MELVAPLDGAGAADFVNDPQPLSSNAADTTAAATLCVGLIATLPASLRPMVDPGVPTRST
jgi:hypothetical protein